MEENIQQNETSIIPVEIIPAKKPFSKKTLTAIFSAVIIVLCIAAAIIINANRPINRFDRALKAGEYDVASAIYEQNSSDEKFVAKTIEKVSSLLSSSLRKYADGGIPYLGICYRQQQRNQHRRGNISKTHRECMRHAPT